MSFDPNQNTPPMGHAPAKKSGGALKWILGGLGCFGLLIALCVGGFAYLGYSAYDQMMNNPAMLEAKASLESSAALGEKLGNPVTVGNPTGFDQSQSGQRITITYEVPLSGPNGSGSATIKVEGQVFTEDWNLESVTANVNGEDVPLESAGIDINIEDE